MHWTVHGCRVWYFLEVDCKISSAGAAAEVCCLEAFHSSLEVVYCASWILILRYLMILWYFMHLRYCRYQTTRIHNSSSLLILWVLFCLSPKKRIASSRTVILMVNMVNWISKASNSITDYLTDFFVDGDRGSHGLSGQRARKTQLEVGPLRNPKTLSCRDIVESLGPRQVGYE